MVVEHKHKIGFKGTILIEPKPQEPTKHRRPSDDQCRHRGREGAKFIVVVNPLVPYVNDFERSLTTVFGTRARRVADMGIPAIASQTFRLIAHARLHEAVNHWTEKYPGVDIILVEPQPNDELMFGTPIMDYSRRLEIGKRLRVGDRHPRPGL